MRRALIIAVIAVAAWWVCSPSKTAAQLRVATFNIEYYPQTEEQATRALDVIADLDAPIVALQEITDRAHLEAKAHARLGPAWSFVGANHPYSAGVLFDASRVRLLSTREYPETIIAPRLIPAFEARFDVDGTTTRVLVLHLKAGGDGIDTRRRQLNAFAPVLAAARASGDRIVVLGDFNATSDADRQRIAALARGADMEWASEKLDCTCYWQRDSDCVGSALDQMLTSSPVHSIDVKGACADGCEQTDRCPAWRDEVSDHCPVVAALQ